MVGSWKVILEPIGDANANPVVQPNQVIDSQVAADDDDPPVVDNNPQALIPVVAPPTVIDLTGEDDRKMARVCHIEDISNNVGNGWVSWDFYSGWKQKQCIRGNGRSYTHYKAPNGVVFDSKINAQNYMALRDVVNQHCSLKIPKGTVTDLDQLAGWKKVKYGNGTIYYFDPKATCDKAWYGLLFPNQDLAIRFNYLHNNSN